jgi:hypothetical protein
MGQAKPLPRDVAPPRRFIFYHCLPTSWHPPPGDVSTGIFCLVVPVKFTQYLTTGKVGLPLSCVIQVCVAQPDLRHGGLGQDLPALPAEQDPLPHQDPTFPHPHPHSGVFLTFMSIGWARYNLVIIVIIFLLSLTAHPNGWKLFPFPLFPQRTVHEFLFSIGLPVLGYPLRSLPIADHNLQQMYGLHCATCLVFCTIRPLFITRR